MKKFNNVFQLTDWFTKEVNKETIYFDIDYHKSSKFLYYLEKNYTLIRPKKHNLLNTIDVDLLMFNTFLSYSEDKHVRDISGDERYAIMRVIRKKIFGWYPFNYRSIDRIIRLLQ